MPAARVAGAPAPVSPGVVALISMAAPAPTSVIGPAVFAAGRAAAVVLVPCTVTLLPAEYLLRSILANRCFDIPLLHTRFGIFGRLALTGIAGIVIGPSPDRWC